jgi:hypothetical protein
MALRHRVARSGALRNSRRRIPQGCRRQVPLSESYMDAKDLLKKSQEELDALFRGLESGPIPDGPAKGTAIIAPGSTFSADIAEFISVFAWQGKVFDAKRGVLRNRITPFGLNAIIATISKEPSWFDKQECICLDYSQTSLVAKWIRDEIRQLSGKLYLGKVYWDGKPLMHFALEFS